MGIIIAGFATCGKSILGKKYDVDIKITVTRKNQREEV